MRFVILGAGGIGATIGGRLHQSGHDVVLIARGAHGEALRRRGLTLASPDQVVRLDIPTALHPRELEWQPGDVAILAAKSQDTAAAARDLQAAAGSALPVVSAQNGVVNERLLSRWFDHVHGLCVMCPTAHLEPGVVVAHSAPTSGILDLGRFPEGVDEVDEEVATALRASRFESVARPDIMRWKYRKLINNLGNSVQALCGDARAWEELVEAMALIEAEADLVLAAAGIDPVTEAEDDERRADHLQIQPVEGQARGGGSTWQSLTRGSGVETDYLNGEISLLGRLHGVPTPANARLQALMTDAAARHLGPGSMTPVQLLTALRA